LAKGRNDSFNGLPGQYIPKKRIISTVMEEELKMGAHRLNNLPRID